MSDSFINSVSWKSIPATFRFDAFSFAISKAGSDISVATRGILYFLFSISFAREIIIHPLPVPISNTLE